MRKDGMLTGGIDNHGYTPTLGQRIKKGIDTAGEWTRDKQEKLENALNGQIYTDNTSTRPSAYISYDNSNSIA